MKSLRWPRELGIHLSPEEAVLYRKFLMERLSQFDAFVQARVEKPGRYLHAG